MREPQLSGEEEREDAAGRERGQHHLGAPEDRARAQARAELRDHELAAPQLFVGVRAPPQSNAIDRLHPTLRNAGTLERWGPRSYSPGTRKISGIVASRR
ncbi:MAG: hypothetical protein ACYS22_20215, partial [Planctomycetota bacterium]